MNGSQKKDVFTQITVEWEEEVKFLLLKVSEMRTFPSMPENVILQNESRLKIEYMLTAAGDAMLDM